MLKIKKAEDFGLGFNCMTRLYMNGYDEEILDASPRASDFVASSRSGCSNMSRAKKCRKFGISWLLFFVATIK